VGGGGGSFPLVGGTDDQLLVLPSSTSDVNILLM